MSLLKLIQDWQRWQPEFQSDSCCHRAHIRADLTPMPDHMVCEREQTWRAYVRARDGNPEWMKGSVEFGKGWKGTI